MARTKRFYVQVDEAGGLKALDRAFGSLDKETQKRFRQEIQKNFTDPLVNYSKAAGRAFGRHGPRLAGTLKSRASGQWPTIIVGSLGEPVWAGAEFGGRAARKEFQTMSWPNVSGRPKTRKVIKRRQTMQFLPHLGTEGYIVFKTWGRYDRTLSERLVKSMDNFVQKSLGGE